MIALHALGQQHHANTVQEIIRKRGIFKEKFQLTKRRRMPSASSSLVIISLAIFTSLASCTRCEDCELNGNSERICETEFDSPDQYELAIEYEEDNGATCTPVGP